MGKVILDGKVTKRTLEVMEIPLGHVAITYEMLVLTCPRPEVRLIGEFWTTTCVF